MILALAPVLPTPSPLAQRERYHEVVGPAVRFRLRSRTVLSLPRGTPKLWSVFVPAGASLPTARLLAGSAYATLKSGPKAAGVMKDDALGRPFLQLDFASAELTDPRIAVVTAEYAYELRPSRFEGGAPATPPVAPTGAELASYLAATDLVDFKSEHFSAWLDGRGLRLREGEETGAFARRVADTMRACLVYTRGAGGASATLAAGGNDCGSLASVAVGALRANGIPARFLTGGTLQAPGAGDPGKEGNWSRFATHATAEFWHPVSGWVPFDGSNCTARGAAALGERPAGFFALSVGGGWNFMAPFGYRSKTSDFFQLPWVSVNGNGDFTGLTVETEWTVERA